MDKVEYISTRAKWLYDQLEVGRDELDLYIIETLLEEVFMTGVEEGKANV